MTDMKLIEHFKEYLLNSFNLDSNTKRSIKIKFEAIGKPISENDVTDNSFSKSANKYPFSDCEIFIPHEQKIDSLYEILINGARLKLPCEDDASSFNAIKAEALSKLHKSEMASDSIIPILYHLSNALPSDWYRNEKYWTEYTSGYVKNDCALRVVGQIGSSTRVSMTPASVSPQPLTAPLDAEVGLDEDAKINFMRELEASGIPSTTETLQLKLKYCIVRIERQWLEETLFNVFDNWYLPGRYKGEISKSPVDFKQLPVAMIVVRELSVNGKWNAEDIARIPDARSFGPFSLADHKWSPEDGVLKNERAQIIGWICTELPPLPPLSDPRLLDPPKWMGTTEEELRDNLDKQSGLSFLNTLSAGDLFVSIIIKIQNYTDIDLQYKNDDKKYGIYKDTPPVIVRAKSSQGFSTSRDLTSGPEGWVVYSFNDQYNVMLYWQNFVTATNKGCMSFIPTNISLTRKNLERYTKQERIINTQGEFICNAIIKSGFQKAVFTYSIMPIGL